MTTVGLSAPASASDFSRARSRRPVVLILVAVLVLALGWVFAYSSVFGVKTVTVRGLRTLTATEVGDAAAIRLGAPLVRLDTDAIRRRVAALPAVAAAVVSVHYPATVVIDVTERVPVGYEAAGSDPASTRALGLTGYALIDKSGQAYRTVTAAPNGLPRFALPTGSSTSAGGNGHAGDGLAVATGHAVATVGASLTPAVLAQLAEISADSPATISLILRDGRTVTWGSAAGSAGKAQLLPALLARAGRTFDVSNPGLVVVR